MSYWIGIWTTVWLPLSKSWLNRNHTTCVPSLKSILNLRHTFMLPLTSLAGPSPPLLKEGNLKTLHMMSSKQGTWSIRRMVLLPFWKIVYTTRMLAVVLVNTLTACSKRERGFFLFASVKYTWNIQVYFSINIPLFGEIACGFTSWYVYSEALSFNFPPLECILHWCHQAPCAWLRAEGPGFIVWALEYGAPNGH